MELSMPAKSKEAKELNLTTRAKWREWLLKHHATESEVWLVFHKKHTGVARVPYEDAVEEALCFGWIDSIVKKIDDDKYKQKFTPRRKKSEWSELNKKRARKMIRQGLMAEPGLEKIKEAKADGRWGKVKFRESPVRIPLELRDALKEAGKARENFDNFPTSYQKLMIGWIMSAKTVATRERRIKEAVQLTAKNKRLGMK
jgi:uncharacterized protein YdeI (YjbR/CyaY-like superfamily)